MKPIHVNFDRENERWELLFPYDPQTVEFVREHNCRWDSTKKLWWTQNATLVDELTHNQDAVREEFEKAQAHKNRKMEMSRAQDTDYPIPIPAGLSLRPYQKAGIYYGMHQENTLIGDDMGLGKTVQAIGIVNCMPDAKSVLIVCPASLKYNWYREFTKWSVKKMLIGIAQGDKLPREQVVIINYDILGRHAHSLREREWDAIIIDEAHYLKTLKARRSVAIIGGVLDDGKKLPPLRGKRNIAMTGTPIPNKVMEIFALLKWLDPNGLGRDQYAFKRRYVDFQNAKRLDELQARLRGSIMIRRLKKDVLTELPPKERQVVIIPPQGKEAEEALHYEKNAHELKEKHLQELKIAVELAKADGGYTEAVAMMRNASKQAFSELAEARKKVALAKVPMFVSFIEDLLETEPKVVIFAHHKEVIVLLMEAFKKYNAVKIDGSVPTNQRQQPVDAFQQRPDVRVFIGSIMAAGTGITLTAAKVLAFIELDWVPGNVTQAEDRIHRMGQLENVLIVHFIMEGSMDANVVNTLITKQKEIEAALDKTQKQIIAEEMIVTKDRAATDSVTVEKIGMESDLFNSEFCHCVHQALKHIAANDGDRATDQNGIGFNKIDSGIGNALAGRPSLTPRQAVLGIRIARKYHKQLPSELVARLAELSKETGLKK